MVRGEAPLFGDAVVLDVQSLVAPIIQYRAVWASKTRHSPVPVRRRRSAREGTIASVLPGRRQSGKNAPTPERRLPEGHLRGRALRQHGRALWGGGEPTPSYTALRTDRGQWWSAPPVKLGFPVPSQAKNTRTACSTDLVAAVSLESRSASSGERTCESLAAAQGRAA